jgi:hypothetical protein
MINLTKHGLPVYLVLLYQSNFLRGYLGFNRYCCNSYPRYHRYPGIPSHIPSFKLKYPRCRYRHRYQVPAPRPPPPQGILVAWYGILAWYPKYPRYPRYPGIPSILVSQVSTTGERRNFSLLTARSSGYLDNEIFVSCPAYIFHIISM